MDQLPDRIRKGDYVRLKKTGAGRSIEGVVRYVSVPGARQAIGVFTAKGGIRNLLVSDLDWIRKPRAANAALKGRKRATA